MRCDARAKPSERTNKQYMSIIIHAEKPASGRFVANVCQFDFNIIQHFDRNIGHFDFVACASDSAVLMSYTKTLIQIYHSPMNNNTLAITL